MCERPASLQRRYILSMYSRIYIWMSISHEKRVTLSVIRSNKSITRVLYLIGKYYIRTITNLWYMYCWCNTTASILQSASNSYKPHNNVYKHLKVKGNCFYIANWSEMPLEKVTYCSSSEKAHNNIWWLNMKNSTDVIQFINDCRLMYIYSNENISMALIYH